MTSFRWIAVIIAMILGLGVARLLMSALEVFRARWRISLDWVPLVWAATIFLQQLAFWWNLEEAASRVEAWRLSTFILLVGLVFALFLAASLILPSDDLTEGQSLRTFYDEDGRWALLPLATFNSVVALMNFATNGGRSSRLASSGELMTAWNRGLFR